MAIEDAQWTLILGLIGLIVGLLLPSGLDLLGNYALNQTELMSNPVSAITGFVVNGASAMIVEVFSTLFFGLIMGFVGLVIDLIRFFSKNKGGFYG